MLYQKKALELSSLMTPKLFGGSHNHSDENMILPKVFAKFCSIEHLVEILSKILNKMVYIFIRFMTFLPKESKEV